MLLAIKWVVTMLVMWYLASVVVTVVATITFASEKRRIAAKIKRAEEAERFKDAKDVGGERVWNS